MLQLLAVLPLMAAPAPAATTSTYSGRDNQLRVDVPREDAEIKVDGVLDEPAWETAARLTGFSQYAPTDGRPAEHETEVRVFYSRTAIHFAIRAQAPAGSVRCTLANRDDIDADDNVQIFLSTFNDGRQALVFGVNPLGVQADGALLEGTQSTSGGFSGLNSARESTDLSPDYVFDSKGRLTADGYDVEVRI